MNEQAVAVRQNVLIGITHTPDMRKIIREPRTLKLGIGLPRGKACDIYVNADGKWVIRMGKKGADGKLKFETVGTVATRAEAESIYRKAWKMADVCLYPRKVPYFVFTRPVIGEDGGEIYVPDFQAIETHSFADPKNPGPPTEIDILFLDDNPFSGGFAFWSASQLKCSGDGENAMRILDMASTPEEKELAKAAAAAGKKTFPIVGGCWTCNCPYSKEQGTKPAPCKPSADIRFQLARNIRVGGTAFFRTSSFRTIPQLFSGIERIKELTGGRLAGIPLKLVVRSHKTAHNGQSAVHQNVAIEFRAEDMDSLRKNLIEQAWKFRAAAGLPDAPPMMIAAPAEETEGQEVEEQSARAMADEFYPDAEEAEVMETSSFPPPAAIATLAKQTEIAEKLKAQREAQAPPPPTVVDAIKSGSTEPVHPPVPQWHLISDRATMNATLTMEKSRVGDFAFAAVLRKHNTMMGNLKADDPVALAIYQDLRAIVTPAAPVEDPF